MLALITIVLGLAGTIVLGGDPILLKIKASVLTGAFGVASLVSLLLPRPLGFYFTKIFAARGDPGREAEIDRLWQYASARFAFRVTTVVWGLGLIAEAVVRYALAVSLPTARFLAVSPLVQWVFVGGLIAFSIAQSTCPDLPCSLRRCDKMCVNR